MSDETAEPAEIVELRAEVARLQALVGPGEQSYADLLAELDAAGEAAKQAELAAGRLRGETVALRFQLARAQPGASLLKRLLPSPAVRLAVVVRAWLGRAKRRVARRAA